MELFSIIIGILFWFAIIALCIYIIWLPVTIAKKRKLCGERLTGVMCLTILGIFCFPLWIAGIIMACVLNPQSKDKEVKEEKSSDSDLERLEKLHTLYKNKVITKAEYDKQRKKIIA